MNIIVSNGIVVSGVGIPLNGIEFPSGQFLPTEPGSQLCAFLSSVNATFGFNLTPHVFNCEFIPCGDPCAFHGASGQLPDIGHRIEFFVGDFFVRGLITHADYTASINGTVVRVTVEDERRRLRKVKIHTEDLGESVPSGIVSVARAFRKVHGLVDINGDPSDPLIKEYERILHFGCTYAQMLEAIELSFNEGRAAIPTSILPTVVQVEENINGTIDAIRFQFNLSQLDEALSRVLQDTGYDWYWGLDNQRVNLINKRIPFQLNESSILDLVSQFGSASGLNETQQLGFGQDVVPDPTRFRVLGGHQHGFINSRLLSPLDGLDTSALDGRVVFQKVWDRVSIGFYDADGFYRTYIPSEKELQFALASIESWSYFKKYQTALASNNPPGFNLPGDAGSTAAQHPTFQSRLDPIMPLAAIATGNEGSGFRVISNRRDEEHNWTIAFYNRVRSHASRHYGRSYVLENLLFNQASGLYRLIDAAWSNVENQVQGFTLSASGTVTTSGVFVEDYEINRSLGPISPFVTDDFRVAAYCVLPSGTVYGPQGDDVPADFGGWTEDAPPFNLSGNGDHYIPISLTIVGQRIIDPRSDELYSFEAFPEGTIWCQLPINAGPESGVRRDSVISSLATLLTTNNKLTGSGLLDIIDPAKLLNAYQSLSGVAIPVEGRPRYGQTYPSQWVLGQYHYERDEDVQLDDLFVPWAFSPEGNKTSLQVMTDRAVRRIEGKIVPQSFSRYGDFQQVGLPLLSFDAFAEQGLGPSGEYGEISHGVSELNISFGINGFLTRYKIQSYFPQFGKEAPLGERVRAILNGILNPIDFTDLKLLNNNPLPPNGPPPSNPFIPPPFFDAEETAVRVTIVEVNNNFTLADDPDDQEDERYRGRDQHNYLKPPHTFGFVGANLDFQQGAICIDGFLNIDDEAIYHTDDFELPNGNFIQRYFTQGRSFANGTIVEVARVNADDPTKYDVTIVDPGALGNGIERAIFAVEVLNGSVQIGDKTTLAAQGDAPVSPGASEGRIFINGTTQEQQAGVTPVEIIAVSNQGLDTALATCKQLGLGFDDRLSIASGTLFFNVVPIPFRQFAASGDRGFLTTFTETPSGGFGITGPVSFVEIVRPAYRNF